MVRPVRAGEVRTDLVQKIHGDYHALWIDPANSDHMFVGSDGGLHLTWDGGRSLDYINTIPLAQFYEVSVDSAIPYRVCGGLQDNGCWVGPNAHWTAGGVLNEHWSRLCGGDGFFLDAPGRCTGRYLCRLCRLRLLSRVRRPPGVALSRFLGNRHGVFLMGSHSLIHKKHGQ